MDFAWLWPLARRWLFAVTLTTAAILLARLCMGCSVSAPELPDVGSGGQCLEREELLADLHAAADADGLSRTRICCANQTRWVGEERADWYEAQCIELDRLSEACGASGWECG